MTYDSLMTLGYVCAAAAAVLFIAAVILFFTMNIIGIIGDMSGRIAIKAVVEIRYFSSSGNTKTWTKNNVPLPEARQSAPPAVGNPVQSPSVIPDADRYATEKLRVAQEQTTLLGAETSRTSQPVPQPASDRVAVMNQPTQGLVYLTDTGFVLREEMIFIHTNESIA